MSEMRTLRIRSTMLWSCSLERDTPGMTGVLISELPFASPRVDCLFLLFTQLSSQIHTLQWFLLLARLLVGR